jgi:hypothetical protein
VIQCHRNSYKVKVINTKLHKLAFYIRHSCESRNPVKSIDSRLRPAGMTEP